MKMEIFVRINFNLKIILLLFLIAGFYIKADSQECQAKLTVKTDENKSLIYLDSNLIGSGNIETELNTGSYIISVRGPVNEWDSKIFEDTILVSNCNDINLSYNFNSSVYLKSNPQDAFVSSGDTSIGYTPLFISKRLDKISLSKSGYEKETISLNKLPVNNTIQLKYTGETNGKSFYEKGIFKILVGSIIVLGGTTAYFKLKADDRYDTYQQNGQKSFLDETRRFDLISGITMTALQINFGVLIYYFLTD